MWVGLPVRSAGFKGGAGDAVARGLKDLGGLQMLENNNSAVIDNIDNSIDWSVFRSRKPKSSGLMTNKVFL